MDKKLIALQAHLKQIVGMFYQAQEPFKAQAFNRVVTQLTRFKKLEFKKGKLVTQVPGVGEAIRDVIEQFYATGTSEKFKKLSVLVASPANHDPKILKAELEKLFKPLTIRCVSWGFADGNVTIYLAHKREQLLVDRILLEAGLRAEVRQTGLGVKLPLPGNRSTDININFGEAIQRL